MRGSTETGRSLLAKARFFGYFQLCTLTAASVLHIQVLEGVWTRVSKHFCGRKELAGTLSVAPLANNVKAGKKCAKVRAFWNNICKGTLKSYLQNKIVRLKKNTMFCARQTDDS